MKRRNFFSVATAAVFGVAGKPVFGVAKAPKFGVAQKPEFGTAQRPYVYYHPVNEPHHAWGRFVGFRLICPQIGAMEQVVTFLLEKLKLHGRETEHPILHLSLIAYTEGKEHGSGLWFNVLQRDWVPVCIWMRNSKKFWFVSRETLKNTVSTDHLTHGEQR